MCFKNLILQSWDFDWEVDTGSYLPQRMKFGSRPDEYTDQREDGDENLVAAGDSRGSEYLDHLYRFLFMFSVILIQKE